MDKRKLMHQTAVIVVVLAAAVVILGLLGGMCNNVPMARAQEQMTVTTTAYVLRGTMRWGRETYDGAAACSPDIAPGSLLRFPENGWVVTCEDTGSGVTWRHVDVWMASYDEAIQFGRRTMTIEILRWGWP